MDRGPERALRDRLLAVMDQKDHWAWPHFTRPGLSREQLLVHFRHEYLVYVRDFPVLLARALGVVPPIEEVRRALAENVYEEQTGGLLKKSDFLPLPCSHPSCFGLRRADFADDDASLHPSARAYASAAG